MLQYHSIFTTASAVSQTELSPSKLLKRFLTVRLKQLAEAMCMGAFVDLETHMAMRESLDTEPITFTMFNLWLETIEYDTIAKLNENSWLPGCRTI